VGAMIQSPFGLLASVVSSSSGAVWCDLICVALSRSPSEMRLMKGVRGLVQLFAHVAALLRDFPEYMSMYSCWVSTSVLCFGA
jgi:hypothetical protein